MKKRDKRMLGLLRKELGLSKGTTPDEVMTALDELQHRARIASIPVAELEADARIRARVAAQADAKARADAVARRILSTPEGRRGFEKAKKQLAEGTFGLTDEQARVAARLGFGRARIAEISAAMIKAETIRPPPSDIGENGNPDLTPEQLRFLRRLGIEEPTPQDVKKQADAMRNGFGVELEMPRPAA